MSQTERTSVVRFAAYELNLQTAELRKNGRPVKLQDQPARLLALLVSRHGELVPRTEIEQTLWSEDTFVEFDHAINTAMRKVRDALGDDLEKPRFIETVPRKGYRFVAPIENAEGAASLESVPGERDNSKRDLGVQQGAAPTEPAPIAGSDFAMRRDLARGLFLVTQFGYLAIYCSALYFSDPLEEVVQVVYRIQSPLVIPVVIVAASCGIAVRLYLITSLVLSHPAAGEKYLKLFPFVFLLDTLWAMSPLLLVRKLGFGLAFGAISALAYLPFSQRVLVRRIYER